MLCPQCKGSKTIMAYLEPGFRLAEVTCLTCDGTGEVDDHYPEWRERGAAIKRRRLGPPYENQMAAARRLGIDIVEYSRMERGLIDPSRAEADGE